MKPPLPKPPLSATFGSAKDLRTGTLSDIESSGDWKKWFSQFYQGIAYHLVSGLLRYAQAVSFVDGDTTPSVAGGNWFREANTAPTTITAFDSGVDGQEITILFTTANTTVQAGANMKLAGAVNFVGTANAILTLISDGAKWYEKSRSIN